MNTEQNTELAKKKFELIRSVVEMNDENINLLEKIVDLSEDDYLFREELESFVNSYPLKDVGCVMKKDITVDVINVLNNFEPIIF